MPLDMELTGSILRVTLSGTLTNADLRDGAREVDKLERSLPNVPNRLTDTRPVTRLEIDFQGVLDLANARLRLHFPNAFKSAIIAADVAHYGFARMFQTLNDHPKIRIAIFPDEAEALAWLAEPGLHMPARRASPRATEH